MALSPQERTWAQLQENLQRKRQTHGLNRDPQGAKYNRYKKAPSVPLPRIVDSPSDAPLRGSHYPVIPPVANDRFYNDDAFSVQSYNSDFGQSEDFDDRPFYSSSPQGVSHPYPYIGTARGHHAKPPAQRDPWNSSTRVRGERRPFVDSVGHASRLPARHQQRHIGHRPRREVRGRDPRVGGFHSRHVWRDPNEEAQLEDDSATVVQRHYRGYRARKNLELLQHLQNPSFALSFMHHFLKDALQNDLILDVACEVLVEERSLKQQHTETRRSGVNRLTDAYSPSYDSSFWEEALDRPDIHRPVAASLVMEVIREESRGVVSDGVSELLQDYFNTKVVADTSGTMMTEVLVEMLPDLLKECQVEVAMETVVEDLIDVETQSCVGRFLQEALVRGNMPLDSLEKQMDIQEVARVAESSLLDAALLDHLLSAVVTNVKKWSHVEFVDRFLDDWLLEILLGQYIGIVHNRRATEECIPLKRLHEKVVTDVALDTIFSELTGHLQEDLQDLDEYERDDESPIL
ncbi:uncharacterized protein LOC119736036 isoform X2 [Patiria miniata]|uniref:Uncharacterized protein n=1 Tax=Patiria miniata TaxID=46514 RepID=A0A914ARD6_PATMI|nr:uncharacterized protein LOC119736036 isoform X2 [Patiria miniata]